MPRGTRESEDWAFGRIFELRKVCVEELYDDPLFDDYFDLTVDSPDGNLMKNIVSKATIRHPVGQRTGYRASGVFDCFVYNLDRAPASEAARQECAGG